MGIDACIFDADSKEYLYFDRVRNLAAGSYFSEGYSPTEFAWDLMRGSSPSQNPLSKDKLLETCSLSSEYWKTQEDGASALYWIGRIEEFVQARPGGKFFVVTDHDDPTFSEFAKTHGYREVGAE